MTYTTILDGLIDQDSPLVQVLFAALRDNPTAIALGSLDAPVLSAGWHPFDMAAVGDGNDGVIYDFAADGAARTINGPALEDGFEYMLLVDGLRTGSPGDFHYRAEINGSWSDMGGGAVAADQDLHGRAIFELPRVSSRIHRVDYDLNDDAGVLQATANATRNSAAKVTRVGVQADNNFTSGKLVLLRRREFLSA